MNEWGISEGDFLDFSPMGKRIENFLIRNSEYVIYLRLDRRFPCIHGWSQENLAPSSRDVTCPTCRGFGYKITPQIVPSRVSRGDAELKTLGGDLRFEPGYIDHYKFTCSFPRNVYPSENDLMLNCEWNKPTQKIIQPPVARPLKITSIFAIKQVNTNFMREIGWVSCGIKSFEIDKDHIDNLVPYLNKLEVISPYWKQDSWW